MLKAKGRRGTLITYLIVMAAVLIPFFKMVAPYLMAILMGSILAVLFFPLYRRLVKKGLAPKIASGLVTIGFLILVLAPLTIFTISAVRQTVALISSLTDRGVLTFDGMTGWFLNSWPAKRLLGNPLEIQEQIRRALTTGAQALSGVALGLVTQIPDLLLQLGLGLFATFFLLADAKDLFEWASDKIPLSREIRLSLFQSFRNTSTSVVAASVAAATTQALIMLVAFLALGIPGAFLAGGATFIFAWIPLVGSFPVMAVGALYLYFNGAIAKMVIFIIIGVFTGVIDNFVRSLVLRGRDEMHPLVSLVAMFGGIALFGIVGVFVGPILAALVISVLNTWPSVARQYGIAMGDPDDVKQELGLTDGPETEERATP